MTILEALRATTESIKVWAEAKFFNKNNIDSAMSSTSENPVQNKVVNTEIENLKTLIGEIDVSEQISSAINAIDYPVDSVNGKTGDVVLTADDVGALPSDTVIPDALSDLTDDSTHRTVTDVEKATWNAKSDFSGSYNDLTDKPIIPSIDGLATEVYVNEAVAAMVDSAPETLDTLNELAAALGDDPNFATTIATEIGSKADVEHTHGLMSNSLIANIPSTTTDSGWSMLEDTYDPENGSLGYMLKSIRTELEAPEWMIGNYSAGIAFGGKDTKGVITHAYNSPRVKFTGGSGSSPTWHMTITGESGKTYDLADNESLVSSVETLNSRVGDTSVSEQISAAINEATADDFGVYVQDAEPAGAVAGDIWIDTSSDPSFIEPNLPEVTEADNGKILMVVNGTWQAVTLNMSVDANGVLSV